MRKLQPRRQQDPFCANSKQWRSGRAGAHAAPHSLVHAGHVFVLNQLWHMQETAGRATAGAATEAEAQARDGGPAAAAAAAAGAAPETGRAAGQGCRGDCSLLVSPRAQGKQLREGADVCAVEAVALEEKKKWTAPTSSRD